MISQAYVQKIASRVDAIEAELSQPATASNQRRYRELIGEHQGLKNIHTKAERYLRLVRELEDAKAMAEGAGADPELAAMARAELDQLTVELPAAEKELRVALLPPDPDDSRNTILEIRAGTGGEEAALFAGDLYRMYVKFAERRGWKTSVLDANPGNLGGYKEIIFSIEGRDVYRTLRYESGGHRVQRIPETEASGRIHTSAATVAVLPEAEEVDDIEIKPEEIRLDLFRASGPGGQAVNKTESAVRITHLPTGIVAQSQDERSQVRNREKAMRVLRARVLDKIRSEGEAKLAQERRTQIGSGDRSERIRTYNFPQNRVTDHRINMTLYSLDRFVEGEMDELVESLHDRDVELKLKVQLDLG
jgi:peptide chain release factor 1